MTTETRTVQERLLVSRQWLQRMSSQGEDYIWRGAMDALDVLNETERNRCQAADRIETLEAVAQAVVDADGMDGKDTVRLLLELNRIGKIARAALSPPSDNEVKP